MEIYEQNNNRYYNAPPRPKTWLASSILTTIFCCLPFGIVGIVYAAQVSANYEAGRYEEAERASRIARNWTIASFLFGGGLYLICLLLYFNIRNKLAYPERHNCINDDYETGDFMDCCHRFRCSGGFYFCDYRP